MNYTILILFTLSLTTNASNVRNNVRKLDNVKKSIVLNRSFGQALSLYEKLHQSFFDNNLKAIKASAKSLLEAIEAIENEKISKVLSFSKTKLSLMIDSKNLETSRSAMNIVSQAMLIVLEKHVPNKNYARYYCPMVKKYWIQNISDSDKVMNPYAADTMPHCGTRE
jgi:hypothetical protein